MAQPFPTITVDASKAMVKLGGVGSQVRTNLRSLLPPLIMRIGNRVDERLNTELKTRRRLKVNKQLVERGDYIGGVVKVVWTGDDKLAKVPEWIDTGTRPHEIWARGARGLAGPNNLAFFWSRMGRWFFGTMVHHPGTTGLFYVRDTLKEFDEEIIQTYKRAMVVAPSGSRRLVPRGSGG